MSLTNGVLEDIAAAPAPKPIAIVSAFCMKTEGEMYYSASDDEFSDTRIERQCHSCRRYDTHTDHGICRICRTYAPSLQYCHMCRQYEEDVWNNCCRSCRERQCVYLCEQTGNLYRHFEDHFDRCPLCWTEQQKDDFFNAPTPPYIEPQ